MSVLSQVRARLAGPLIKEYLLLVFSTGLFQVGNLAVNLIAARVLSPASYGLWNVLMTVSSYLAFLQFGVSNGMAREVPVARGARAFSRVEGIQNAAFKGLGVSVLLGCALLLVLICTGNLGNATYTTVFILMLYFAAYQGYTFVYTYCQSHAMFLILGKLQISLAVASLFAAVMVYFWKINGLILGQGIALVVFTLLGWRIANIRAWPVCSWREWGNLVRSGLPIMAVSMGYTILTTTDRWVALRYLGLHEVGNYMFQIRLVTLPLMFVTIVANQFYPRMAEEYGRSVSVHALLPHLRTQALVTLGLSVVAALVLWLILPIGVTIVWPQYTQSLTLIPILLLGSVLLAQCSVLGVFLNVIGKQWTYLMVQVAILPIGVLLGVMLTGAFRNTFGTALASLITYAVYTVALIIVAIREIKYRPVKSA